MTLELRRFSYRPSYINAVQVTASNMVEVADFCGGIVVVPGNDPAYIKVPVKGTATRRQTMAFIGDWVFKAGASFKVYTSTGFAKSFVEVPESDPKAVQLLEKIFTEPSQTGGTHIVMNHPDIARC